MQAVVKRDVPLAPRLDGVVVEHRHKKNVVAPNRQVGLTDEGAQRLAMAPIHVLRIGPRCGHDQAVERAGVLIDQPVARPEVAIDGVHAEFGAEGVDGLRSTVGVEALPDVRQRGDRRTRGKIVGNQKVGDAVKGAEFGRVREIAEGEAAHDAVALEQDALAGEDLEGGRRSGAGNDGQQREQEKQRTDAVEVFHGDSQQERIDPDNGGIEGRRSAFAVPVEATQA